MSVSVLRQLVLSTVATRREVLGCLLGLTVDLIASLSGQILVECKRTSLCEEGDETLFDALCFQQNSLHNVPPWHNAPQNSLKVKKYPANHTNVTDTFHPTTLPTNVLRFCTWSIHSGRGYL